MLRSARQDPLTQIAPPRSRVRARKSVPKPLPIANTRSIIDLALGSPDKDAFGSSPSLLFASPGLAIFALPALFSIAKSGYRRLFRRSRRTNRSIAKMVDGNVAQFSVATFNLRGIMDRWGERRPVLKSCLKDMDADVLCFQECLTGEYGQDRSLLEPSYHVFPCKAALFNLLSSGSAVLAWYARAVTSMLSMRPFQRIMLSLPEPIESFREKFRVQAGWLRTLRDMSIAPFFGNSVACRLVDAHEIDHSTLVLGDWRAAQRIEFELCAEKDIEENEDGEFHAIPPSPRGIPGPRFKVWVVNTHLDHEHADNRQRQAMEVIEWMEPARAHCAAIVLCGDFNGNPSEPFHHLLKSRGYKSGYFLRHGREPEGTWPTGIEAPCRDEGSFECLDYVYVWARDGYDLQVVDAQVYGDQPDPKDSTLYPSDHTAIKVSLRLEKVVEGVEDGLEALAVASSDGPSSSKRVAVN